MIQKTLNESTKKENLEHFNIHHVVPLTIWARHIKKQQKAFKTEKEKLNTMK